MNAPFVKRFSDGRRVLEIVLDDEFSGMMAEMAKLSAWPTTRPQMIARWIALGLSFDMQRPVGEAENIINRFVKIAEK